jgi:hypothetical protein
MQTDAFDARTGPTDTAGEAKKSRNFCRNLDSKSFSDPPVSWNLADARIPMFPESDTGSN